jgi:ElaB/YqjD/DUF883 family membrane-anchored ribosome-binding protein
LIVTDTDTRRTRIKKRVEASQARLRRDSHDAPAKPRKSAQNASPPDDLRDLVREYPWAALAAGAVAGVALGALLPKGAARKLVGRGSALAGIAAELAIAYGRQARTAAAEAGHEGAEKLGELGEVVSERTAGLRRNAVEAGEAAATRAQGAGRTVLREAVRLASRIRG